MNDDRPLSVLERLDRVPVPPPPTAHLLAAGQRLRRRRRRAAVAATVTAVALVVAGGAVALRAAGPGEQTPPPASSGLTEEEVATAEAAARALIEEQRAIVTSATVVARAGTVSDSNTGHPCRSGRELQILLIGVFPHTVTTGSAAPPGSAPRDSTVRSMGVTVDADSGLACLIGVGTGQVEPPPGSTTLDIDVPAFLPVRVTDRIPSFAHVPPLGSARDAVRAEWDATGQTLTYVSRIGYSGSCPPTGSATVTLDGDVMLSVTESLGRPGHVCTADARQYALVVEGVTSWPSSLTVTEHGSARDVPVATTGLGVLGD